LGSTRGGSPSATYSVKIKTTEGYFFQNWSVPQPSGSPPASVGLAQVVVSSQSSA
jgi:hypothetical protein